MITLEVPEGHFPALGSLTGQDEGAPDGSFDIFLLMSLFLYLKTEIQLHLCLN